MAAFEQRIMANRKAAKPKGLTKEQANRFGFKPGQTVSGVEAGRINRAQRTRTAIESKGGTYKSPYNTAKAEESAYEGAKRELTPKGGGKGGPSALDRYVQTIQGMLTGGEYRKPQDDLMSKLQQMYGTAQTNIGSTLDALKSTLEAQQNPYTGFQAQAAAVSPQLTEFLQSQGASTDPLAQLAAVRQQEATNQAGAFQNLANTLGTLYGQQQAGQVGDVAQQRANMLAALEGARAGYGTQIENTAFDRQNKLLEMLLQGVAKGGRPKAGSLVGSQRQVPANVGVPVQIPNLLNLGNFGMGTVL